MGFGHRVYRAEDPRARVLRRTCQELSAPRYEAAIALEKAALTILRERRPDHPIETNVEFWAAVILDFAQVPPHMMPALFTSARTAGWSAHILEQKRENKLVRPSAQYIGPGPRRPRTSRGGSWSGSRARCRAGRTRVAPASRAARRARGAFAPAKSCDDSSISNACSSTLKA